MAGFDDMDAAAMAIRGGRLAIVNDTANGKTNATPQYSSRRVVVVVVQPMYGRCRRRSLMAKVYWHVTCVGGRPSAGQVSFVAVSTSFENLFG
jgi:hypothetical protein